MPKRPLLCFAVVFCLGIIFAEFIDLPFLLIYLAALIFLFAAWFFFWQGLRPDIFLFCLVFLCGAGALENSRNIARCHISKYVYYNKDSQPYTVKGFIVSQPLIKNNRTIFIFKTEAVEAGNLSRGCRGNLLVYVKGRKDLVYGERLILRGNLSRPFKQGNPAGRSYLMCVKSEADMVRLNKNYGFFVKRFALWLKDKMEEIIFRYTSSLTAAVLGAMVLGDKKNIPWFVNNAMMKSGTVHILVVSGFNVGIVGFIIVLFLKLLRLSRQTRFYLAIACLIVYCLLTGASTPVVRATIMGIFFLVGILLKRELDIYNSCALAAIFILAAYPRQLFDAGFQLSFASVLSIVYLYPALKVFLRIESLKIKLLRFLSASFLVSFSAWLGTAGFIAYYFKVFSPITVVANILIVPLATLITLCGFSLILIGLICPGLAPFFASTSELAVILLLKVNAFLIKTPGAYFYLFDKS